MMMAVMLGLAGGAYAADDAVKALAAQVPEGAKVSVPAPNAPARAAIEPAVDGKGPRYQDGCYYDGDDFVVVYQGSKYSASADDNSATAVVSCSDKVSAMYDGDDFIVFNPRTKSFKTIPADDNVPGARISASGGLAVLYDGDDIILYNADTDSSETRPADDKAAAAEVIASPAAVMAWDGDDLSGYCAASRRWVSSSGPDDNQPASAQVAPDGRTVGMTINGEYYALNPDSCQITRISEPVGLTCSYNGDDFLIKYEGRDYTYNVDDNYGNAAVACGVNTAVMYDGDDIIVFDGKRRSFYTHTADDKSSYAAVIAGDQGALVYDGDDMFGYCASGSWITAYADDNVHAVPSGSSTSASLSMRLGTRSFRFNSSACSIQQE